MEGSSGVSEKGASGAMVVMAVGPLLRRANVVLGVAVGAAADSSALRSVLRYSGAAGEERLLVGLYRVQYSSGRPGRIPRCN